MLKSSRKEGNKDPGTIYRSNYIKSAIQLINILRNTIRNRQITARSKEISAIVQQLCQFQLTALYSTDKLHATTVLEPRPRIASLSKGPPLKAKMPHQKQVKSIKSQQRSISRERERIIQG